MSQRSSKRTGSFEYLHPSLVTPVIEGAIDPSLAEEVATMFSFLADSTRLRILQALALTDELCVYDVSLALGISQSALSHQLAFLRAYGVVARRKQGRIVFYRLVSRPVRRALLGALRDVGH